MKKVIAWLVLMALFIVASIVAGVLWGPDYFEFGLFVSLIGGMLGAMVIDLLFEM